MPKNKLIVESLTKSSTINIAIDTLKKKKQAIVFVASKASAEKQAMDISKSVKLNQYSDDEVIYFENLSEKILHALSNPTTQCKRLSECIKKGIAFHHSGLTSEQRSLIEDSFRENKIRIICSTPTLAAGLDLPAFRTILNSLKRYGNYGMSYIPVMEYKQMAGRAGRPGKEDYGEAIIIATNEKQKEEIKTLFIDGEVEDIQSKLAVEPVLRTYLLSLISTGIVKTKKQIFSFFGKTFWAHQFNDTDYLHMIIEKMIFLLKELKFIETEKNSEKTDSYFKSADKIIDESYKPTKLGARVSQLYLDPLTANQIIQMISKLEELKQNDKLHDISYVQMICSTLEMRPYIRLKNKDWNDVQDKLIELREHLVQKEPELYEDEYDDFFDQFKTALMLLDWINESTEQQILDKFQIRPGEIKFKTDNADWILYSAVEIAKIIEKKDIISDLEKVRIRVKNGVKAELLSLLKIKGIGRVRARRLFAHGFRTSDDVNKINSDELKKILGEKTATKLINPEGKKETKEIKKIKNQNLNDFF
ncbi:hypothetical protein JXM83_02745 [Candidatus Woesearchaeota archaeon]|nr:hypothetical protein [Candidatus Woesearchaeota archaeon]